MMKIMKAFLVFLLLTSANSYATTKLRFIGDQNFATGEKFQETEIGGLSGIIYDKTERKLFAISDDRSQTNESRFYEFSVSLDEKSFAVKPTAVVKLKKQDGSFFKKGEADFEGITMLGKDLLISSEGGIDHNPAFPPEFYRFSRTGNFVSQLPVPEKFLLPKKDNKEYGSRDNKSFEALGATDDGKTVFLGSEEALKQDGPIASITGPSTVRIILYKDLKPVKEFAYQLEKVETQKAANAPTAENGLVDFAVIDDTHFYTMERSWLPSINKNIIRIFRATIDEKTTDLSKVDSLKDAKFVGVQKELVADLDDFLPFMNPQALDNIEGIALGPILMNGNRTLIVVSDNNFGKTQRTLFMAFEVLSSK